MPSHNRRSGHGPQSPHGALPLAIAHLPGAKLMLGSRPPSEPVDVSPERVAPSSTLARLRIFWPGTTMRCSANCSPGLGLNGSGLGLTNAGQVPSGSSRDGSPFLSATFTT